MLSLPWFFDLVALLHKIYILFSNHIWYFQASFSVNKYEKVVHQEPNLFMSSYSLNSIFRIYTNLFSISSSFLLWFSLDLFQIYSISFPHPFLLFPSPYLLFGDFFLSFSLLFSFLLTRLWFRWGVELFLLNLFTSEYQCRSFSIEFMHDSL